MTIFLLVVALIILLFIWWVVKTIKRITGIARINGVRTVVTGDPTRIKRVIRYIRSSSAEDFRQQQKYLKRARRRPWKKEKYLKLANQARERGFEHERNARVVAHPYYPGRKGLRRSSTPDGWWNNG